MSTGRFELDDRTIDLAAITVPVLVFAGATDGIAPVNAVKAVVPLLTGAAEVRFEIVPGGHLGMLTGRAARGSTWRVLDEWVGQWSTADEADADRQEGDADEEGGHQEGSLTSPGHGGRYRCGRRCGRVRPDRAGFRNGSCRCWPMRRSPSQARSAARLPIVAAVTFSCGAAAGVVEAVGCCVGTAPAAGRLLLVALTSVWPASAVAECALFDDVRTCRRFLPSRRRRCRSRLSVGPRLPPVVRRTGTMAPGTGAEAAVVLAVPSGSPEMAALSFATTGVLTCVAGFEAPGVVAAAEAASAMPEVTVVSVA